MLDAIRDFFGRHMTPAQEAAPDQATGSPDATAVAACALLLELAYADDTFSDEERRHLQEAVTRHFALSEGEARELIALADRQRREAVDLFQFTRLIAKRYDEGQKMVLAEIMWRIVLADGELAAREQYLLRKVSGLLQLEPGYLAAARRSAAEETD